MRQHKKGATCIYKNGTSREAYKESLGRELQSMNGSEAYCTLRRRPDKSTQRFSKSS
jgi:hypothetical protein